MVSHPMVEKICLSWSIFLKFYMNVVLDTLRNCTSFHCYNFLHSEDILKFRDFFQEL